MQMWVESKANASNIGTFIRFYIQMRVEKNTKHLPIDSIGHSHNSGVKGSEWQRVLSSKV